MASTKLIKNLFLRRVVFAAVVFFMLFSFGCGTIATDESGKPLVYSPEVSANESTLDFIPKLKKDRKGRIIPYKFTTNPYLKKRGAIEKSAVTLFIEAKRAYDLGNYQQSEDLLNKLLEENKSLSGPWVLLGDIALKKDNPAAAKEYFARGITVNKNNVNAYIRLAKAQRMRGDFMQAKNVYVAALKVWKDFPEAHLNLGVLYDLYLNDKVKAQKHIEAYQFLTDGKNQEVARWLSELQDRTGMAVELNVQQYKELIAKSVAP